MGSVPTELAADLRSMLGLERAVETGTYRGGGTRVLAGIFPEVVSIELSPHLHEIATAALADLSHVTVVLGDSSSHLPFGPPAAAGTFYWLDGHWSVGETAGADRECPVLGEIAAIGSAANRDDCLVIDDARYFTAVPPPPHRPEQWPTLLEVFDAIRARYPGHHITLLRDLVIAVPIRARGAVDAFAQREVEQPALTFRDRLYRFRTGLRDRLRPRRDAA